MPGAARNEVDIEVESNELRISGRRKDSSPKKIDASMDAGVLTLILERKESEKPRTIPIKSA